MRRTVLFWQRGIVGSKGSWVYEYLWLLLAWRKSFKVRASNEVT